MSLDDDDEDLLLGEMQAVINPRGAGLQTQSSNVPLKIDQDTDRKVISLIANMQHQISNLLTAMASIKDRMIALEQSNLNYTIQLGNQTEPIDFGNATPIIRQAIGKSVMFSPSPLPTTTDGSLPSMAAPILSPTSADQRVPLIKFARTMPISTELALRHSISAMDKNCDNISHLDEALRASGVLTLANGSRPSPVPTPTNMSGYSPQIITSSTFDGKIRYVVVDEDDWYRYNSENETCMYLMKTMLNKDMLHHLQLSIEANNATRTYLKILEFFKGHKHHHIESARLALNNFKFTAEIEKDIFSLRDLISSLEKAQDSLLTDTTKLGVLRESMRYEKREPMTNAFHHACLNKLSFNDTLETISKVWNNIPSNNISNRMAAVTTDGEEKICFRFNQGGCKAKACKYVHRIMTEQEKEDTGYEMRIDSRKKARFNKKDGLKNSMNNNNSSGTNGMHNPNSAKSIPTTREHYMAIDNRRGKITDSKPRRLSKTQLHTTKSISILENNNKSINYKNKYMQGHFKSWENQHNMNSNLPTTNIASFTQANFDRPESTSDIDLLSSSIPAILNRDTPVRLNIPLQHLVDHHDREAKFFESIDPAKDIPINVFTSSNKRKLDDRI